MAPCLVPSPYTKLWVMTLLCDDPSGLPTDQDDADASALWRTEIERRAVEVIEGRAELEDAELVHQQITERLRSRRR